MVNSAELVTCIYATHDSTGIATSAVNNWRIHQALYQLLFLWSSLGHIISGCKVPPRLPHVNTCEDMLLRYIALAAGIVV